jgi:drug/metabolite transporter (DMT)-like permease
MGEAQGRSAATAAVAIGAALLGLAPIGVRLSELGPQATNFWRFALALPILALAAAFARPSPDMRQTGWLLGAGLLFGLDLSLWAAALGLTTVANATLLANMTPLFAALFAWVLFRERLRGGVLVGGVVALVGALVLALARAQSGAGPDGAAQGWLGDGLGLAAALGYAGYLLIVRALRGQVGVGAVMFWASLSAAVFALLLSLALGERLLAHTARGWAILLGLGIVTQVGAQGLIAWGVGRLPIVVSAVLLWLQPLSAAVLSWLLFDERFGPLAFVGAGLILGGLFLVQRARA